MSFLIVTFVCAGLSYNSKNESKNYIYRKINSIQYVEDKEDYSDSEGITKSTSVVSFIYPDMMRVESSFDKLKLSTIEIYNGNNYLFYDNVSNKISKRECFKGDFPDVINTSKNIVDMLNSGKYELMGYEDKDDKKIEIAGTKYKSEGHSYIYKVWITYVNDVTLPLQEEYFVDNVVVSKSAYTYLKVNEFTDKNAFTVQSLPNVCLINDGVEPKYVDNFNEIKKYTDFKFAEPEGIPEEYELIGISLYPPVKSPMAVFSYGKDKYRLEFIEQNKKPFEANGIIGEIPCKFERTSGGVYIMWNHGNITITLHSDAYIIKDAISAAEEMADGRLRINGDILNAKEVGS